MWKFTRPSGVAADGIDDIDETDDFDLQTGFLPNFANCGFFQRFAEFLAAARNAPLSPARRFSPLDQQKTVAVPDNGPDTDKRLVRVVTAGGRGLVHIRILQQTGGFGFPVSLNRLNFGYACSRIAYPDVR